MYAEFLQEKYCLQSTDTYTYATQMLITADLACYSVSAAHRLTDVPGWVVFFLSWSNNHNTKTMSCSKGIVKDLLVLVSTPLFSHNNTKVVSPFGILNIHSVHRFLLLFFSVKFYGSSLPGAVAELNGSRVQRCLSHISSRFLTSQATL